jgi:hypothetical protein
MQNLGCSKFSITRSTRCELFLLDITVLTNILLNFEFSFNEKEFYEFVALI